MFLQNRRILELILASANFTQPCNVTAEEYEHLMSARLALLDALVYSKELLEPRREILEEIHLDMPPQHCPPLPPYKLAQIDEKVLIERIVNLVVTGAPEYPSAAPALLDLKVA